MSVSLVMPVVMYIGCRGAAKRSEPILRAYAFAMSMVITMQVSVVVVAYFDDGAIAEAYADSCAVGFMSMCSNVHGLPLGIDNFNMDEICRCSSLAPEERDHNETIAALEPR